MASTQRAILGFVLLISLAMQMVAGRDIPAGAKGVNVKQSELFGHFDGSVLVPGIGRFMIPEKGSHAKPFHYNPITGKEGGHGVSIPRVGGLNSGAGYHQYVPGLDDTFVPNPGVEVPNPVGGRGPAASHP